MAMTFDELVQAGIQKETDTEAFYRYWAEQLADPGARVLLSELAEEEAKHCVFFQNLKETDIQPGKTDQVLDLHIGDYLLAEDISQDSSIQDVLISAIHREDSAIKFFSHLAGRAGKMQSTFERLAGEEKKHKLRLETFYDDNILTEN